MSTIWAYGRISGDEQNRSLAIQRKKCERWIEYKLSEADSDYDKYGGWWEEQVSARTTPFLQREMGSQLAAMMGAGDLLVVSNFDRLVRSSRDIQDVLDFVDDRGCKFTALDLPIDHSTSMGRAMLEVLGSIKSLEVAEIRRRVNDGLIARRNATGSYGTPPVGWYAPMPNHLEPDIPARLAGNHGLSVIRSGVKNRTDYVEVFRETVPSSVLKALDGKLYSDRKLLRLASRSAIGWPIMNEDEVNQHYFGKIGQDTKYPDESVPAIRVVDLLLTNKCWPHPHPAADITEERLRGFATHRKAVKFQRKYGSQAMEELKEELQNAAENS